MGQGDAGSPVVVPRDASITDCALFYLLKEVVGTHSVFRWATSLLITQENLVDIKMGSPPQKWGLSFQLAHGLDANADLARLLNTRGALDELTLQKQLQFGATRAFRPTF